MQWITTDNVRKETWRRLLEFANDDFAITAIERNFGKTERKYEKNVKKQAKQIRLCLLQAKEYLDSAEHSSIFTSPNLLYYSTVALCTATMLINGTGEKSIDFLRLKGKNRQHGLSLQLNDVENASKSINLLKSASLTIEDSGFFKEWYETLPSKEKVYFRHNTFETKDTFRTGIGPLGLRENQPFEAIVGEKATLLELLKRIPDQVDDLKRLGIQINASRGDETANITNELDHRRWTIHNAGDPNALQAILNEFRIEPEEFSERINIKKDSSETGAIVEVSLERNSNILLHWPEARWSSNGRTYLFSNSFGVMEIVDGLGILFILGMVCRYYPDVWIETIDKHSISAKIIENTVETLKTKIPILALELMAKDKIIISSQLPPWHS